ncbi:unnamed protein product, partial [Ixodes persulcatus]
LAVAVLRAISQSLHPGASAPQPGPSAQPPPVAAFGGLRLQPNSDTQSTFPTTTTSDTWQMGTQVEYQSHPATHAAAAAPPEPRIFAPYAAASDTGRFFVQPEVSYNPYTAYNPQVAGRQRVFTVLDPPPSETSPRHSFTCSRRLATPSTSAEEKWQSCNYLNVSCRSGTAVASGSPPGTSCASSTEFDFFTTLRSPGGEPPCRVTPTPRLPSSWDLRSQPDVLPPTGPHHLTGEPALPERRDLPPEVSSVNPSRPKSPR